MGWQYQPPEPLMLGPRIKVSAGAETHKQSKSIQSLCLALPPLSNVKFHLLPSTSNSGLQFPIATLSLEVLSQPLQLPDPNPPPPQSCLHEEKGRTLARNLFMTSVNSLQPSPVVSRWSQGCSEAQNEAAWMKTHSRNSAGGRESF